MRVFVREEVRQSIGLAESIDAMRAAVIAVSRGQCDTPMPMHLYVAKDKGGEIHIKSSYRAGGPFFALKMAGTFPERAKRGEGTGNGMILLVSIETGDAAVCFEDRGYLTDLRTAAVSAMVARELGRTDTALGILGSGVQARLQAQLHATVLPLSEIHVWGRNPERASVCVAEIGALLPRVRVTAADSPSEVAACARLIVTATGSREPLLQTRDIRPGTLISAVGADSPGKRELDSEILRKASLLLVDSLSQCEKLGELQHALSEAPRAIEIGAFCERPVDYDREGTIVADFTGLGAEDLFIAEACYERLRHEP